MAQLTQLFCRVTCGHDSISIITTQHKPQQHHGSAQQALHLGRGSTEACLWLQGLHMEMG